MANTKKFSKRQLEQLKEARQIIADAKSNVSVQPRFQAGMEEGSFSGRLNWPKGIFETVPPYTPDSRARTKWLQAFWPQEPMLAGLINSVVEIDRNRSWELVGGRNQVARFIDVIHNWQVQPGRCSYREGIGTASLAFNTTDIGALIEVGRQFKGGPMAGMYAIDPSRSVLTSNILKPVKYYPSRPGKTGPRVYDFEPQDYMRVASAIDVDETFNGLGHCSLSRALELAILMIAVYRHEGEQLFARAPQGLLLLSGINQATWDNAMKVRDAKLDSVEREWFGGVAVLAGSGVQTVEAKLLALSQLPKDYDQEVFTNLLMYGYALAFGYDPREFWPVSSGSFGTVAETEQQHKSATGKGAQEFTAGFQEELQGNLPDTLQFNFIDRDIDGEMAAAELAKVQVETVMALCPSLSITPEQAMELLAEDGVLPRDWTPADEDVGAMDTDADAEGEDSDDVEGTDEEGIEEQIRERVMEYPCVQRARIKFPKEQIVVYEYPSRKMRVVKSLRGRTVHPVAKILQRIARESRG